jgi:hypothetical protein
MIVMGELYRFTVGSSFRYTSPGPRKGLSPRIIASMRPSGESAGEVNSPLTTASTSATFALGSREPTL